MSVNGIVRREAARGGGLYGQLITLLLGCCGGAVTEAAGRSARVVGGAATSRGVTTVWTLLSTGREVAEVVGASCSTYGCVSACVSSANPLAAGTPLCLAPRLTVGRIAAPESATDSDEAPELSTAD